MYSDSDIAAIESRFVKGSNVYGVSPSGKIDYGVFRGVFWLPRRIYVRYQIDISENESQHYLTDNRVFETRAEAEACARKLLGK